MRFDQVYKLFEEEIDINEFKLSTIQGVNFTVRLNQSNGVRVDYKEGRHYNISRNTIKKIFLELSIQGKFPNCTRQEVKAISGHSLSSYIMPIVNKLAEYTSKDSTSDVIDKEDVFTYLAKGLFNVNQDAKNYVLIIDEINRGNIPAIFGELITLIEASKRIGAKEALHLTLPLSSDDFGVPKNLYIIGTMNTADKSVEALDAALRRRFSFTPKYPEHNHKKLNKNAEGVNIQEMLKNINKRIKVLKGADYQIGHSYFMDINTKEDLTIVFKNKVLPLLNEYFYEDLGKVQMILGDTFIESKQVDSKIFLGSRNDFDDLDIFELQDDSNWKFDKI